MRVETAIKMIQNHGLKAFVTAEGLTVVDDAMQAVAMKPEHEIALADGDAWFEEITTFPVNTLVSTSTLSGIVTEHHDYTCATVESEAIRNYLGY